MNTPAHRTKHSSGFTLIEILVAITIVAILSGVTVLSLNIGGHDGRLRDEAQRLFQLGRIASDDAVFKSSQFGLRFTQKEYTFYRLEQVEDTNSSAQTNTRNKKKRQWQAVTGDRRLRDREWPEDVEIEVLVDGVAILLDEERDPKVESDPHIIFLSNGEIVPNTEIQLRSTETEKAWRVGLGEDGLLALTALQE